jgi:hypothetical protein
VLPAEGQAGIFRILGDCGLSRIVDTATLSGTKLAALRSEVKALRGFIESGLPSFDPARLKALGQSLFETILPGRVRALYNKVVPDVPEVRPVELFVEDQELASWPWEYLYDSDRNGYMCQGLMPVSRSTLTLNPLAASDPTEKKLALLVAVTVPAKDPQTTPEVEVAWIREVFQTWLANDSIELNVVDGTTPTKLVRELDKKTYDILHLYGHGGFDWAQQEGYLWVLDEEGKPRKWWSHEFAPQIQTRGLRLIFVNACESGRIPPEEVNARASLAGAILELGVPAVVSNQYTMPAASAHYLAAMIYNYLVLGYSLADAVRGGRLAVFFDTNRRFLDWGIPALYSFRPGMALFSRSDRPGWAEPFEAVRSTAQPSSGFLRSVIRHATPHGPAIAAGPSDARPHRDKACLRVALVDIDAQVEQLPELVHRANESQSYYDFQVVYLPAPAPAGDQVVLQDLEPFLKRVLRDLDVDRVCYLTRRLVRGVDPAAAGSQIESIPGNPFLIAVSTHQLRGAAAAVGVPFAPAVFRRCLAVLVAGDGRWQVRLESSEGPDSSLLAGGMDVTPFRQLCDTQIKDPEQVSAVAGLLDLSESKAPSIPALDQRLGESFVARVAKPKALRVAVLRSGNLAYTRDITFGLRKHLEMNEPRLGRHVQVIDEAVTAAGAATDGGKEAWAAPLQWLDSQSADYNVGIGTQAAEAIVEHLGPNFARPFIFLGVSYPMDAGLVSSMKDRKDDRNIAGVSYGGGVEEVAGRIHQLFPDRKLVFIG